MARTFCCRYMKVLVSLRPLDMISLDPVLNGTRGGPLHGASGRSHVVRDVGLPQLCGRGYG